MWAVKLSMTDFQSLKIHFESSQGFSFCLYCELVHNEMKGSNGNTGRKDGRCQPEGPHSNAENTDQNTEGVLSKEKAEVETDRKKKGENKSER